MANLKYSDLLPFILPELPGCSDPLAEQHIRSAVIDFCAQSKLWRVAQDPIGVYAGQAEYDIDLPTGTSLVQIMSCLVDGAPISPTSSDQLDADYPRWQKVGGRAQWFLQFVPTSFFIAPVPDTSIESGITMMLSVKPSRASAGFPDWIADQYHDALVAGAKARLMRQAGRPWSNPQQAMFEQAIYDRGISTATAAATGSLVRTVQRTTSQH